MKPFINLTFLFKDFIFLREGEWEKDRERERARAQVGGVAGKGRSGPPC